MLHLLILQCLALILNSLLCRGLARRLRHYDRQSSSRKARYDALLNFVSGLQPAVGHALANADVAAGWQIVWHRSTHPSAWRNTEQVPGSLSTCYHRRKITVHMQKPRILSNLEVAPDSPDSVEAGDVESVLNLLMDGITNILNEDPDWDIFTQDFQVIFNTGTLEGLGSSMYLVKLLRTMRKAKILTGDVHITDIDYRNAHLRMVQKLDLSNLSAPIMVAHWQMKLGRLGHQFLFWSRTSTRIPIEGQTAFLLDDQNKVNRVLISNCLVDGQELQSWPDVKLSLRFL